MTRTMSAFAEQPNGRLRRVPVQERGNRRVEAILDAAAEIFTEIGVDKATMEGIAERSGSSIGSLYQFFPGKEVIFQTLLDRSLQRSQKLFERMLPQDVEEKEWPEMLDLIVDGYAAFEHSDPGFRAIWANLSLKGELAYDRNPLYDRLIERTEKALTQLGRHLPARKRRIIAVMLVETINAMIAITSRKKRSVAKSMLSETKLMLRRYLAPYLDNE